jgi:hypothetical protein
MCKRTVTGYQVHGDRSIGFHSGFDVGSSSLPWPKGFFLCWVEIDIHGVPILVASFQPGVVAPIDFIGNTMWQLFLNVFHLLLHF